MHQSTQHFIDKSLAILLIVAAQTTFMMFLYKPKKENLNPKTKGEQVKVYEFKEEGDKDENKEDVLEVYSDSKLPTPISGVKKVGFRSKNDSTYEN